MASVALIIAPQQFRDEELLLPRQALQQAGHTVLTASTQTGNAEGMLGHVETVSHTLADLDADTLDAIVVVGGFGAVQHLWDNTALHQLCRHVADKNGLVAAICVSPVVLAKAGLLQGKKATVYDMPESRDAFEQAGVSYTGEPVTTDGRLITGNGPEAAEAFAQALVAHLQQVAA